MADPRVERTKQKLFRACFEEVADRGYGALTVERVLRRAGVSKGAFYYHFKNRADLFHQAYRAHTMTTVQAIESQRRLGISIERLIIGDILRVIRSLPDRRMIPTALELAVVSFRSPEVRAVFGHDHAKKTALAESLFREGIKRGEFRRDLDPVAAAHLLYWGIFGLYLFHYALGESEDIAAKMERSLRFYFRALKAR